MNYIVLRITRHNCSSYSIMMHFIYSCLQLSGNVLLISDKFQFFLNLNFFLCISLQCRLHLCNCK
ncbi:Uncharacterized protein APZ42_013156 [Daphnia magna]|uniref:Uncharacterized protein n=1 Tax=Daphnia magna TaxID=35525 RepID=A0A0P6AUM1_9CRUS|nr:Uncharacterized protein APZ42_013156 [Daphnia magna]